MSSGIFVSSMRNGAEFDHDALVAGIARSYSQRGISVKFGPVLPGGKRADLAVGAKKDWTYIEVKTRFNGASNDGRRLSFRQELLREILRLSAHSLKQLPRKEASLMVLATSASPTRRKAISKIAIARSFANRIFDNDSHKVMGLLIFAPFRSRSQSERAWKYAATVIPNPASDAKRGSLEKLTSLQL